MVKQTKKSFFRRIHLKALVALIVYFVVSNFLLAEAIVEKNSFLAFLIPILFGVLFTFGFLYLFNHEDFFHFIRDIEKRESKKEKKLLHKFLKFGKILACLAISFLGGPLFLALTIRFLFPRSKTGYWVGLFSTVITTVVIVGLSRGVFHIFI